MEKIREENLIQAAKLINDAIETIATMKKRIASFKKQGATTRELSALQASYWDQVSAFRWEARQILGKRENVQ